jgi:hypothetical protein
MYPESEVLRLECLEYLRFRFRSALAHGTSYCTTVYGKAIVNYPSGLVVKTLLHWTVVGCGTNTQCYALYRVFFRIFSLFTQY